MLLYSLKYQSNGPFFISSSCCIDSIFCNLNIVHTKSDNTVTILTLCYNRTKLQYHLRFCIEDGFHCALPAVYPQLRFATVSSQHALDASAYCLAAGICSQAVIFYQALMKIVSLLVLAGKCFLKCCYCIVSSSSAAEHCKQLCCCC